MIDEKYYKLAADELDTSDLKSEVWDRACKLASDDKEEAQLLYINLRVEEMLGNDDKQEHAFTADHASNDPMISSVDKFDALVFEDDTNEFDISDQIEAAEATDYAEVLGFDAEADERSFSDMSNVEVLANDDIPDFETIVDLTNAAENREYTTVMDSGLTDEMLALAPADEDIVKPKAVDSDEQIASGSELEASDLEASNDDSAASGFTPPEAQKTALLAKDFERQAMDMGEIELEQNLDAPTTDDANIDLNPQTRDEPYSESFNDALNNEDNITKIDAKESSFDTLSEQPTGDEAATSAIANTDDNTIDNADDNTVETAASDSAVAYEEDNNYDPLDDLLNNLSSHAYNDLEQNQVSDVAQLDGSSNHDQDEAKLQSDSDSVDNTPAEPSDVSHNVQNDAHEVTANTEGDAPHFSAEESAHTENVAVTAKVEEQTVSPTTSEAPKTVNHTDVTTKILDNDSEEVETVIEIDEAVTSGAFMVFNRDGKNKLVKQGSSLPAMLITFPWLLSKTLFGTALTYAGLWIVSLAGLITGLNLWANATGAVSLSTQLFTAAFGLLAIVGLFYLPYRFGNSWVADKLQKNGFEFKQAIDADSKKEALESLHNQLG